MVEASPADVRLEVDTHLDDPTLTKVIERKARDIDRDDGVPELDTQDRQDLEAVLAALHVATKLDRSTSSKKVGDARESYEDSLVDELRADARRLGATDELLGIGATDKTASISVPSTRD